MKQKVARPLGNGAIERVKRILSIPEIIENEQGEQETIYSEINTFNFDELFNLSEYQYEIHRAGNKFNTIETFIKEKVNELKRVQNWFNDTTEKECFYSLQHYIDYLEKDFKGLCKPEAKDIEANIYYYENIKIGIVFNALRNTIETVCTFIKPISTSIQPNKYFTYFLKGIDFNKIDYNRNKTVTLKYCNTIYYGLEQLLKADINKAIQEYQNGISMLTKEQISETQIKLIELIGNFKRQARTNEAGISFSQRYISLYESIKAKERLMAIDYQILIGHFNETILNDLLSSYEIIYGTLKEITPLIKTETDIDFLKGEILLRFIPQAESGYFIIEKGNIKKEFTVKKYFETTLQNWTLLIDKAITNPEKLNVISNAILHYNKELRKMEHPLIKATINDTLQYLQVSKDYINSFDESISTPQPKGTNTNKIHIKLEDETDFLHSTIVDWLYPFFEESKISETDYKILVTALKEYFSTGNFPTLNKPIEVRKVNIKRFGWALNEIYRTGKKKNEKLSKEYLLFAKGNISIFTDADFNELDILNSNLYKYFTTKTV